jgi:hypothetical protein
LITRPVAAEADTARASPPTTDTQIKNRRM